MQLNAMAGEREAMLDALLENNLVLGRPEREHVPTNPQCIFTQLNAMAVMLSLMVIFAMQYLFLNGYITFLLVSMLLAGALEVPGNALRLVESAPLERRFKVKVCFLFCGTLSIYLIIYLGLVFNHSCFCNGSA